MIELGKAVILQEGETVVQDTTFLTPADFLLIQQLLAVVALCPAAYDLSGRLADELGELDNEQVHRFAVGEDAGGYLAVIPAVPEER